MDIQNEATVDIQVGAASRLTGGFSKDCSDSLIACIRKGRNTRACREELQCVSTRCSNNTTPAASALTLPVKTGNKNGTSALAHPVENDNGSDMMPDAIKALFRRQPIRLELPVTETIQVDLQGLKRSNPHAGKDHKTATPEMVWILGLLVLILCMCLSGTVWFCSRKTPK